MFGQPKGKIKLMVKAVKCGRKVRERSWRTEGQVAQTDDRRGEGSRPPLGGQHIVQLFRAFAVGGNR